MNFKTELEKFKVEGKLDEKLQKKLSERGDITSLIMFSAGALAFSEYLNKHKEDIKKQLNETNIKSNNKTRSG